MGCQKEGMNVFVSLKLLKVSIPREEKKNSLKRFKGGWFGRPLVDASTVRQFVIHEDSITDGLRPKEEKGEQEL